MSSETEVSESHIRSIEIEPGCIESGPPIERLTVFAYRIPTDKPEEDGTFRWSSTTLVLVEVAAADRTGIGYTYADQATGVLVDTILRDAVVGRCAFALPYLWKRMNEAVRNLGRTGIAAMAISAVDTALWDLKSRLLQIPLSQLFGAAQPRVEVYGSGGFTSYTDDQLTEQLSRWSESGFTAVKIKVGRNPDDDRRRVREARATLGLRTKLFVDANGAYTAKLALSQAQYFSEYGVDWFEEPVSSDNLSELRSLRDRVPGPMEIAAGEYGYTLEYFLRMLHAGAVDVLQADATRCGGFTGFLQVATVATAAGIDVSAHCAPTLHVPVCVASPRVRHLEYFHDHARIENLLFEGVPQPKDGFLQPNLDEPGLGLNFKFQDANKYRLS